MSRVDAINKKLRELDTALSDRRMEPERYRFLRRTLLAEFAEQPSPAGEITRPERAASTSADVTRPAESKDSSTSAGIRPGKLLGLIVGGLVVVALISAGWWALSPKPDVAPTEGEVDQGPTMPQDLARSLMDSPWSRSDLTAFQDAWARMPEASVRAATEDPRMWLLRQEIEHRLRDAGEAVALQPDERNLERVRQLEDIQNLIRHRPGA